MTACTLLENFDPWIIFPSTADSRLTCGAVTQGCGLGQQAWLEGGKGTAANPGTEGAHARRRQRRFAGFPQLSSQTLAPGLCPSLGDKKASVEKPSSPRGKTWRHGQGLV